MHIGCPKTGTSLLQATVFKELGAGPHFAYFQRMGHLRSESDNFLITEDARRILTEKITKTHGPILISIESLMGVCPSTWERNLEKNASAFGEDATILITLRKPEEYLRSLYQQAVKQGNLLSPEKFFLSQEEFERLQEYIRPMDALNVDALNYRKLVDLYKTRFSKVIVVPMENIFDLYFLSSIVEISEGERIKLQEMMASAGHINSSVSASELHTNLEMAKGLRKRHLRPIATSDLPLMKVSPRLKNGKPKKTILERIKRKVTNIFFTKINPSVLRGASKYELPAETNLGKYIKENREFYREILESTNGYEVFWREI